MSSCGLKIDDTNIQFFKSDGKNLFNSIWFRNMKCCLFFLQSYGVCLFLVLNCLIFKTPHPPCPSTFKILPPLDLGRSILNEPPTPLSLSLQMITNEFKQNIIQRWLSYVIRYFLQVGFRFQYQLINRVWLSFDFFSFIWNLTVCFSVALYSCVWRCLKISQNIFYLYLFTFLVLILQSTCFIFKGWKRKQTMEEQPHRACERTKSNLKQNQVMLHSSWPRLLLFDLARKQCNGI